MGQNVMHFAGDPVAFGLLTSQHAQLLLSLGCLGTLLEAATRSRRAPIDTPMATMMPTDRTHKTMAPIR